MRSDAPARHGGEAPFAHGKSSRLSSAEETTTTQPSDSLVPLLNTSSTNYKKLDAAKKNLIEKATKFVKTICVPCSRTVKLNSEGRVIMSGRRASLLKCTLVQCFSTTWHGFIEKGTLEGALSVVFAETHNQ